MAYPPSMMPNEFAGETIQSHRSLSGGRPDNMPSSTVKCFCKFDGRVVIACVHAFTSDSESARGAGEIRIKWGSSLSGFDIGIVQVPGQWVPPDYQVRDKIPDSTRSIIIITVILQLEIRLMYDTI